MARKKTHEEFVKEVEKINPHIKIHGEYTNGNSKVLCECKKCGYKWQSTCRNLIHEKKCLGCINIEKVFKNPDISNDNFKSIVRSNYPNLMVTGSYKKEMKTITCKCLIDGYISRIRIQKLLQNTYQCPICKNGAENVQIGINDIHTANPVLGECLLNREDGFNYKANSRAKVDFICPSCKRIIKNKTIDKVNRLGLKCKCQDGNSLGEKYFYSVISIIDKNVECEKHLNNNYNFRYDFYGVKNNKTWICEVQGKQHSEKSFETCGGRTLEEEKANDVAKMEYAKEQGIDYYIEIDSKESGFNELKNAILNSKLSELYNFNSVDWVFCYRNSLISDINKICDLWNKGNKVMEIVSKTNYSKGTVRRYLTKGNEIGLCDYDYTRSNRKFVKCIETNEIFNSLREAEIKYNIKRGYISGWLKGNKNLSVGNMTWEVLNRDYKS